MGGLNNCCGAKPNIPASAISIYSMNEDEVWNNNNQYKSQIKTIYDSNQGLNYITSSEFYSLLIKKFPRHIISRSICEKLSNNEISSLISKLFDCILNVSTKGCNENTKSDIDKIKLNTNLSLRYFIIDIKEIRFKEETDCFLLQALTCEYLIVQSLLFLINSRNKEDNEYKINIWDNKDIVKEAKIYALETSYFLFHVRKKYNTIYDFSSDSDSDSKSNSNSNSNSNSKSYSNSNSKSNSKSYSKSYSKSSKRSKRSNSNSDAGEKIKDISVNTLNRDDRRITKERKNEVNYFCKLCEEFTNDLLDLN